MSHRKGLFIKPNARGGLAPLQHSAGRVVLAQRGRQTPAVAEAGGRRASRTAGTCIQGTEPWAWLGAIWSPHYGRGEVPAWADGRERQPGPDLHAHLAPAGRRNWKISRFWWKKWRWRREISWCHQQQKYKLLRKGIDSCQTVSKGRVSVEDFWWQSLSLWFKRTGCNCARPLKTAEGKLSKSDSSCSQFSAPLPSTSWCKFFPSKLPGKPTDTENKLLVPRV